MNYDNDFELLQAFKNNEPQAVRIIFEQSYGRMVYYANRLINNKPEAEDIVVTVFEHLLKSKAVFESQKNIQSYLYTSVRYRCFNYLKKETVKIKAGREMLYLFDEKSAFYENTWLETEVMNLVMAEIEQLPAQAKKIMLMRVVDNQSYNEIAEDLGISNKTVRNQMAISIRKLRERLRFHPLSSLEQLSIVLLLSMLLSRNA